jgi:hypothetical protein
MFQQELSHSDFFAINVAKTVFPPIKMVNGSDSKAPCSNPHFLILPSFHPISE